MRPSEISPPRSVDPSKLPSKFKSAQLMYELVRPSVRITSPQAYVTSQKLGVIVKGVSTNFISPSYLYSDGVAAF